MIRSLKNRRLAATIGRTTIAVVAAFIVLFPLYWMIQTALLPTSAVLSPTPSLTPIGQDVSFDAVRQVILETPMLRWFGNSALITIVTAVLSTALSTLGGYALSRFSVPGRATVAYTLMLGRILPGTLVILPLFVMFRTVGLLDTPWAVVAANVSAILPFATFLMKNYFDGVPRELDDAAFVDGCSRMRAMWSVLIPVARPGIAACVAFAATSAWVELLFSRSFLSSPENWTVPVGIGSLIQELNIDWNVLMAAGAISIIPVLIIYWFIQPYLVSGMTAGAVKG